MYPQPSLVTILEERAAHQPNALAYRFLADGETNEQTITYGVLAEQARGLAGTLQSLSTPGERALLLYPPGLEYIRAFFACLYAGLVAVPSYPPRLNRLDTRLSSMVADAGAKLVLTTTTIGEQAQQRMEFLPGLADLQWLLTDALAGEPWRATAVATDALAFLQYTSGSTSAPKGVMLTHGNLLHNLKLIQGCFQHTTDSQGVIWLPPYHDMGLIGGILQPMFVGFPVTLIAPIDFLQKPFRWLSAVSRYHATTSGGPNFAYDYCVEKISAEQKSQLDLSRWQLAFTGAEPVRPETLRRFAEAFAPCGFRMEAFYPCYGLAEGTLIVSGGEKGERPIIRAFHKSKLEENLVEPVWTESPDAQQLVSSGRNLPDQQIEVVDRQTGLSTVHVGEIWVQGPSVAVGYWGQAEKTAVTFGATLPGRVGTFMRTGDLGFWQDGELFIAGREKDLLIIRGRNYYPQDIEQTVSAAYEELIVNGCAAFSVEVDGAERLVVVQEMSRHYKRLDLTAVATAIRQAVAEAHELQTHAVVLIKPGYLPRTSSGKIQRFLCRHAFLDGSLEFLHKDGGDPVLAFDEDESWRETLIARTLTAVPLATQEVLLGVYLQQQVAALGGLNPITAPVLNQELHRSLGLALSAEALSVVGEAGLVGVVWRAWQKRLSG